MYYKTFRFRVEFPIIIIDIYLKYQVIFIYGCCRSGGKRPDGLSLVPWSKSILWDYTCADTYAESYFHKTTYNPGYAAKQAEERKYRHYNDLMDQFMFVPVASKTTGIIGTVGLKFF